MRQTIVNCYGQSKAAPYRTPRIKAKTFGQNITGFFKKPKFSLSHPYERLMVTLGKDWRKMNWRDFSKVLNREESGHSIIQGLLDLKTGSSLEIGS